MSGSGRSNLVVAQSGGPTAVINNSLCGVIEQAKASSDIDRVYGARYGINGVLGNDFLDLTEESPETIAKLRTTPGSALGSCRRKVVEEDYENIIKVFKQRNVGYFIYIGGNDSMDTANVLYNMIRERNLDLRIIGIPKTIDNDLMYTDHCPGYGSAARYYAISLKEVGLDIETLPTPVSIFETMGRHTGWLAASTALAKESEEDAPHLIYVPERPFEFDRFKEDVRRVHDALGWVVVAVSEGLKTAAGEPVSISRNQANVDNFGHGLPGDVGSVLANTVTESLGMRARSEKPGLCGRSSIAHVSDTDREEAYRLGTMSIQHIVNGLSGYMMGLKRERESPYQCSIEQVDLGKVANIEKSLPDHFIGADSNWITRDFKAYARPLVGGKLPDYVRLLRR